MTTTELIRPHVQEIYGESEYAESLVECLGKKLINIEMQPRYGAESREDMIRLTCWDYFAGGGTAAIAAKRIEEALVDNGFEG